MSSEKIRLQLLDLATCMQYGADIRTPAKEWFFARVPLRGIGSCALGAAYEGKHCKDVENMLSNPNSFTEDGRKISAVVRASLEAQLLKDWPVLTFTVQIVQHRSGERFALWYQITYLNDNMGCTREHIADLIAQAACNY